MKINKVMEQALNEQITVEFDAAYAYLAMSAWFECRNMPGCAHWLRKQSEEESGHALKIIGYLARRGGEVMLGAIEKPAHEWGNETAVFEEVYEREKAVTEKIHALADLACAEGDYATVNLAMWFTDEQVEEEDSALSILEKFRKLGESPISLAMIDKELAAR